MTTMNTVAQIVKSEYGINMSQLDSKYETVPTYVEEENASWVGYLCTATGQNLQLQFYVIIDSRTDDVIVFDMISLDSDYIN